MARKNAVGYPTVMGNMKVGVWTHTGPTSYTQVAVATPPTGGDSLSAAELLAQGGLKYADWVTAPMGSDNGQYEVAVIPIDGNSQASTGILPSRNFVLRWLVSATGAEVAPGTNLSARTVKLLGMGPQ
jgi:hypothetical protein